MNEEIKFYKGNKANLPTSGVPGAIYHCLDTKETYLCIADGSMVLFSTALDADDVGGAGIHVGTTTPEENDEVWINPEGVATTIEMITGPKGDKGDKGDEGDKGDKGDDGKTPVKGTDYYTEADKAEMVNAVLSVLPTWNGGSY